MKSYSRADKVGALIQKHLAEILKKDINDPRLEMIIVSKVKVAADIKTAKVYYAAPPDQRLKADAAAGFQSASGYIKRELAAQLGLRYMPELKYFYDESFDYGARIDNLLRSLRQHGEDNPPLENE